MIPLSAAVQSLRPGTQFVIKNDNIETMIWHTPNVQPLTQIEVDAEIVRLEQAAEAADAEREAQRAALLERLGLTADEFAVLVGGIA